jgi:hypothetical protein
VADATQGRTAFLRAYVFLVASLTIMGWGLSCWNRLDWLEWLSVPGVLAAVALARRGAGSWANLLKGISEPLAFGPFILVGGLALVAALIYPPTMLDALTYRLPRILLWLQEDHIRHFLTVDERLNYMPHAWGLATLPLIQLAGDRLVTLWNYASWIVFYLIAYDWAFEASGNVSKSRVMAFIASTSTFAVLQACEASSDLFTTAFVLVSLRFVLQFEHTRDWRNIHWSVLSLLLAADTKPHVAVLALPLAVWFWLAPSKPWKSFRWRWLPGLIPVWLLCSPALSWVLNHQTYGRWLGVASDSISGKNPLWNILLGAIMTVWQVIQPPVNPLALMLNDRLQQGVSELGLNTLIPTFNLRCNLINMVDGASLGLVLSALLAAGVVLAVRRNRQALNSWRGWAMAAGAAGYCLALAQVVPGSIGRAFCVFLFFAVPLAMVGWNLMRPQVLQAGLYLCLASSLLSLVLSPERPLWPACRVQRALAGSPRFNGLAKKMELYTLVPERARAGEALVQAIPDSEPAVAALIGEDRPLLPLFRPYSLGRDVLLFPPHAVQRDLNRWQVNYVIVGGGAEEKYPELSSYVEQSGDYELVIRHDYTSKLIRGVETWKLFRRKALLPVSAYKPE